MFKLLYKFSKSVIPCLLLTLCIGWCYAFSLFAPHITSQLEISSIQTQFTFCLNIFFLGMGAAFFGKFVEKNIKLAAFISTGLLFIGLCLTGLAMTYKNLFLLYLGLGACCGISEGCGYVVPVKNLLLWFSKSKRKGLITAISIISFGLGSTICSWLFGMLFNTVGIVKIFYILAGIYVIPMLIATYLIDKPRYVKIKQKKTQTEYKATVYFKDQFFKQSWLFMFLNISMGLVLIGSCAGILTSSGLSSNTVLIVMMLCGISNGLGRLAFPFVSDYLKNRLSIWKATIAIEILVLAIPFVFPWFLPVTMVIINACYGSGFATLPSVLSDNYGNKELSFVHGLCLSSWGIASLFAFICTKFVLTAFSGYMILFGVLILFHLINFGNVLMLNKVKKG